MNRIPGKIFFLFFLFSISSHAQYSNEWITFGQQYYRIPIAKDGIYKLSYADLQAAGVPVGAVDPRRIQLYHRGVEQAVFMQGQSDAKLDPGDFMEFYGKRNDGALDANLYQPSLAQPHPYYNLYSDTTAYFLTWNQLPVQGKRMASFSEVNVTGIPKEAHHTDRKLTVYANEYSGGHTLGGVLQYTFFDEGEGWTGATICIGNSGCTGLQNFVIDNLINGVPSAGNPKLELMLVGRDELLHQAQVYVGANSGSLRLLSTSNFSNFQTSLISSDINWSDIGGDGRMTVQVKALGVNGIRDRLSLSYIKVRLPQNFDLALQVEKTLELKPNPSNKSYVEIDNPVGGLRIWDITDSNNALTIGTSPSGAALSAVVPSTIDSRILFVGNSSITPSLKLVAFRQINPASHNYLIVTHRSLMKPDAVQAYATYRASTEGGGYDTLTVAIDQLYNQFNFGETSPRGIYQFVKYMVENGSPQYLFLIGKGRDVSSGFHRFTTIPSTEFRDLVPTAGSPASDMAFSAGLQGSGFGPSLATGRLSASTPTHVATYLNKIKEMESATLSELWRKEALHLSGGIQPSELINFRQYMDGFKATAEDIYWGGKVTTIGKRDPSPVELISISDQINKGLNMVTFFGHSSPGTIDLDIGYVSNPILGYENPGKYPVFLINGCNAGNFFSNGISFGEDWMLTADKGARGFIAHSSFGFVNTLRSYTDLFYRIGFGDSTFIQKGIGDVQKEVARQYLMSFGDDISAVTQTQQMVLLADPAIKLFGTSKPDYETNDDAISMKSLDGKPVTSSSELFAIHINVRNFGAAKSGQLPVRIIRTLNDNSKITYDSLFTSVFFEDTLIFKIKKSISGGFGTNQFEVTIDPEGKIKELNESNNSGILSAFIPLNGTKNLFPSPYGIVSSATVNLLFQATDPLSETRTFLLEVDTATSFNSTFLKKSTITAKVLVKSELNILNQDSLVYYWRTKLEQPTEIESKEWATTSFTFINGSSEGWSQSEFPQLLENGLEGLTRDTFSNTLKFVETSATIAVKTFGNSNPALSTDVSVKLNGAEYNLGTQGQPCRDNTINFIAFDKKTLVPYAGLPFNFQDPRTCGREPQVINSFTLSELETGSGDDLVAMVDNIKASDSVLVFSIGDAGIASWSSAVQTKLNLLGIQSSQLSSLQPGDPLVIFGRKGAAVGTATLFTASGSPANAQALEVTETITGKYTSGTLNSVLIGPAKQWNKLVAQAKMIEADDQYNFSLFGVALSGKEELIQDPISGNFDLATVDASAYPYLKLSLTTTDEINLSPVQLKKWMVLYEPVADGLLLYNGTKAQVALQEGQDWDGNFSFVNISNKQFLDSLQVNFTVISTSQSKKETKAFKIKAPAPGDSTGFSVATGTLGKSGFNSLDIFVNPRVIPEQYFENNVVSLPDYLNVIADKINPVLSVTIDNRQIASGDFVSLNPFIQISLTDENQYLLKIDTLGMKIFLRRPCNQTECPVERIYLKRDDVKWFAATATSDFRIEYRPQSLSKGTYLLTVEGADASGNQSGVIPYQVEFQVEEETTVTFQSVYPNPSSSDFVFSFTLTGNVTPTDFSLIVNSLTGAVQQQFHFTDVSEFHIGNNTVIWSPKDVGGNDLLGGMYLFRMKVSVNGKLYSQSGKLIVVR